MELALACLCGARIAEIPNGCSEIVSAIAQTNALMLVRNTSMFMGAIAPISKTSEVFKTSEVWFQLTSPYTNTGTRLKAGVPDRTSVFALKMAFTSG